MHPSNPSKDETEAFDILVENNSNNKKNEVNI